MIQQALRKRGYSIMGALATAFGYRLKAPVFIIATGRCGSTLLVKILESHKQLTGFPGEANGYWHPKSYPYAKKTIQTPPIVENPEKFTQISIDNWPENHGRTIQKAFATWHISKGLNKTLFVKSAMISFMIPQILSLFPKAKFIHIYRNGPSVAASFLKKEWSKYQDYFENEQEYLRHCAKYWNACLLEIEKQKIELSLEEKGVFLEFSYESLCENPMEVINSLSRFLSIPAEDFAFDTKQIVSKNYKVGDYSKDEKWLELLEFITPAMKLKGYL